MGAHYLHARYTPEEITAAAHRAFVSKFTREVDPDGLLSAPERERRAREALRAHMLKLALASSRTRRSRSRGRAAPRRTASR
jgi:hypothetical protein